jgi:hypothetical protein
MRIEITRSAEGPHHDPYSVVEVRVDRRDGRRVVFRDGSLTGQSVRVVCECGEITYDSASPRALHSVFELHSGISVRGARRAYRKLRERCRNCGGRATYFMRGFPGESFECCAKCHHVVDAQFDLSAVE